MCLFQVNATTTKMAVFLWGLVGIVVFYIAMLGVGIWAGTKQKNQSEEEVMLAGRNIGTVVGVLTLIGASVCCSWSLLLIAVSVCLYVISITAVVVTTTTRTAAPTTTKLPSLPLPSISSPPLAWQ